jgi:hypothetical protein
MIPNDVALALKLISETGLIPIGYSLNERGILTVEMMFPTYEV